MDTQKVGLAAARLMEVLERDYPDAELKDVLIAAEVHSPSDEDGQVMVEVPFYCTNDSRIYQSGLVDWAAETVREGHPEDDPD